MAVVQTNTVREFKDLDLNFNIHPIRKDINKHVGNMAVINSVKNLVSMNQGEKFFRPFVGGNIRRLLFENIDPITASNIEQEIRTIIANHEPRVMQPIDEVLVTPKLDENSFTVRIQFRIINSTTPITVTFQLSQIR